MYRALFSLILTKLDPEKAHHLVYNLIRLLALPGVRGFIGRFTRPNTDISVETLGLRFESPFGLAAGFDKDGHAFLGLGALGFGHVEVGTLTAHAQPGNAKPRLFRLVADRALINRMGFNNGGSPDAARRLAPMAQLRRRPVLGINIGKSRVTSVDKATDDYVSSARALTDLADYLVVNVSSPNTPGLRGLQEIDLLRPLLESVKDAARSTPLLVKIAPDLSNAEVLRVSELVTEVGLDGIIATNTTLSRDGLSSPRSAIDSAGAGGLSGAPLRERSLEVLRLIREVVPESLCVISVGGVETSGDVAERLIAGATLVQGYSAFVYRGPLWAREINRGLAGALKARS